MLTTVFSYPKPVVAAINGHAIAGGCVLACAADKRLIAREAGRIGVTELLAPLDRVDQQGIDHDFMSTPIACCYTRYSTPNRPLREQGSNRCCDQECRRIPQEQNC